MLHAASDRAPVGFAITAGGHSASAALDWARPADGSPLGYCRYRQARSLLVGVTASVLAAMRRDRMCWSWPCTYKTAFLASARLPAQKTAAFSRLNAIEPISA